MMGHHPLQRPVEVSPELERILTHGNLPRAQCAVSAISWLSPLFEGAKAMPTYISLIRCTQQGIEKIKESPARLDAARKTFEQLGARIKDFYLVCGRYDAIAIAEAPDATTIAKVSLALGSRGNVRTETLCAFTEDEFPHDDPCATVGCAVAHEGLTDPAPCPSMHP